VTGRHEVARLKLRLDNTFSRVNQLGTDLEARSDFARYLCILVSGYFESAIYELILSYCSRTASPQNQRYVASQLERFTNANRERVLQLLGNFDPVWRTRFESVIVDEREAALNSVIGLRNRIAHGDSVGITYSQITLYSERIETIVRELVALLDPP
jgi:hypothetical protein